jgi:tetratricopeptide (TPR) repeat protein
MRNEEKAKEFFEIAIKHLEKGDWEKAFNPISSSVEFDPENPKALFIRSQCYLNLFNDSSKAMDDLNAAIKLKEDSLFYLERGRLFCNNEKYVESLSDLKRAIQIDPNENDAYFTIAKVHYLLEEYSEAIPYWNKCIELDPNDSYAYSFRGDCKTLRNKTKAFEEDYISAIEDLKKAISLDPNVSLFYSQLATAYMMMLDIDEARFFFNKASMLGNKFASEWMVKLRSMTIIKLRKIEPSSLPSIDLKIASSFLSHLSPDISFIFNGTTLPQASVYYSIDYNPYYHSIGEAFLLSVDTDTFLELCASGKYPTLEDILNEVMVGKLHVEYDGSGKNIYVESL